MSETAKKETGVVALMFDAPTNKEFVDWVHGPHMEDIGKIPGVVKIRRYEIVDGPADRRGFIVIIESEDLQATMAYRNSAEGQRPQQESAARGVTNRYGLFCREIFTYVPKRGAPQA